MRYRLNWLKVGKTRVLLTCEGGALAEIETEGGRFRAASLCSPP